MGNSPRPLVCASAGFQKAVEIGHGLSCLSDGAHMPSAPDYSVLDSTVRSIKVTTCTNPNSSQACYRLDFTFPARPKETVYKRYCDCEALQGMLSRKYGNVNSLPAQQSSYLNKAATNARNQKALEDFISFLITEEPYASDPILHDFLSTGNTDSEDRATNRPRASGVPSAPSLLSHLDSDKDIMNIKQLHHGVIWDKYKTFDEVTEALRAAGLESSQLIIAIDFSKSNTWNGTHTFHRRCLHDTNGVKNFYQRVIEAIGRTLHSYDDDGWIPAFGFGDITTKNFSVRNLLAYPTEMDKDPLHAYDNPSHTFCCGVDEVLRAYTAVVTDPRLVLSGPTSFAPIILKAASIVRETREFHILIIIADGEVVDKETTYAAMVSASELPLSIIMVGVGDGPWDCMQEFDNELPMRKWDNFQFVNFNHFITPGLSEHEEDVRFATAALMEIPDQYREIRRRGLLG